MKNDNRGVVESGASVWKVTRRVFLKGTGLVLAGCSARAPIVNVDGTDNWSRLCFGIVTDTHYADADPRGVRHYRESLAKMTECVGLMNDKKVDFLVELGDFKDEGTPALEEDTLKYLDAIEEVYGRFEGPRYHVLGNHDVDSISKDQFLARVENTGISGRSKYYSFDCKGVHFVVLDANYKADESDYDHGNFDWRDTNIPPAELKWLKKDLAGSSKPVIVFVHQRLDGTDVTTVRNAEQVRHVLQGSKKVLAVFQGHHHEGEYTHIEGVHYYTLKAMVEGVGEKNNSYAVVEVYEDHSIAIVGYRRALSRELKRA